MKPSFFGGEEAGEPVCSLPLFADTHQYSWVELKKIQSNDPAKGRTSLSEFYCLKASKMYGLLVIFVFFAGVILFMVRLRCLSMS